MNETNKNWVERFDKEFPCIQANCDNNGTLTDVDRNGEPEPAPCQYCYENRLPIKSFIKNTITAEVNKEKLAWLRGERCHTCGKEMEHKDLSDTCKDCWETE